MKNNIDNSFPNKYTKDFYGKDILVGYDKKLNGYFRQIMMEWEFPYMEKCIQKLNPFGDVLEVGFGMGYSANEIQKYNITSHTIIECDPIGYEKALEWGKTQKNKTKIIFGKWEDVYKNLGKFDCFFYDPHPFAEKIPKFGSTDPTLIFIRESLNYHSKDFVKISSYFCSIPMGINQILYQIRTLCPNYEYQFNFDKYSCEIPDNCDYVNKKQNLYLPLIEAKKNKKFFYE
jgi:hypothetical protein